MAFSTTLSIDFPVAPVAVFNGLADLSGHPLWNSGMISISHTGRMRAGMRYKVNSIVAGQNILSEVEVVELQPPRLIEIVNNTGSVTYHVTYLLEPVGKSTRLVCTMAFELEGFILRLARPAIEAMAETRLRHDLETLRLLVIEWDKAAPS
ncbi:SRPBCC family protein [Candidatus Saccharibacteria bacterium]|nr:SRPBCC family protein [Candidatus Saccharibacteria bacterium]